VNPLSAKFDGVTTFFLRRFLALVIDVDAVDASTNSVRGFEDDDIFEAVFEQPRSGS
jgi:hypothetical protein